MIIPVEAEYLSAKGMELLLRSVAMTKRKLNPSLKIDGILITRVDKRNNLSGQIIKMIRDAYESLNRFQKELQWGNRSVSMSWLQGLKKIQMQLLHIRNWLRRY